jgi:hypothetical protein
MKILVGISLASFLAIAVFGVFAMNHGSGHDHEEGCIAATAQGTYCPKEGSVLSFLNFHLDAFRSFSVATFGGNLVNIMSLLTALVLVFFGIITSINPASGISYRRRQFLESYSFSFQREITHWLALHENSPAILHRAPA